MNFFSNIREVRFAQLLLVVIGVVVQIFLLFETKLLLISNVSLIAWYMLWFLVIISAGILLYSLVKLIKHQEILYIAIILQSIVIGINITLHVSLYKGVSNVELLENKGALIGYWVTLLVSILFFTFWNEKGYKKILNRKNNEV